MLRYTIQRVLALVPVLAVVTMLVFVFTEQAPVDLAQIRAVETGRSVEVERHELGLDRPLVVRYFDYVGDVLQGDFGESGITGQPVAQAITQRLPRTAGIAVLSLLFSLLIAVPFGVLAATRRNSVLDRLLTGGSIAFMAVPSFLFAVFLVSVLSNSWGWFPPTGYAGITSGLGEFLRFTTLPALALSGIPAAELTRQIRGSLIDALEEDFTRTAKAKGLRPRQVLGKHAAKNAAIPVVTVLGLNVGRIIGGSVIVESIFNVRGFGSLGVESVLNSDIAMLQGIVLVGTLVVVVCNLLVDLSYGYFNPRVRAT